MKKFKLSYLCLVLISISAAHAGSFQSFKSKKMKFSDMGIPVCEKGMTALQNLSNSGISVEIQGDCTPHENRSLGNFFANTVEFVGDAINACDYSDCNSGLADDGSHEEFMALITITSAQKEIMGSDVTFANDQDCQKALQVITHLGLPSGKIAVSAHCENTLLKSQFLLP